MPRSDPSRGRSEKVPLAQTSYVKSVCAIIEKSSQCGVTYLKVGDLEIRFEGQPRQARSQPEEFSEFVASNDQGETAEASGPPPSVPKDVLEQFAEEQQLLDDPLAFETTMIDRLTGQAGNDEET